MCLVVCVFVASSEKKHDLAIIFLWMLNMDERNLYGCQMGGLCALYYVNLAKLKLYF